MIAGAARADAAVMVLDATTGEFEAGFEQGGQTREHGLLVRYDQHILYVKVLYKKKYNIVDR